MAGGKAPGNKGKGYERELVKDALAVGIEAERLWGSNGETRGLHKTVDLIVYPKGKAAGRAYEYYYQAKRADKIPDYLKLPTDDTAVYFTDTKDGMVYVILNWHRYLQLLKNQEQQVLSVIERSRKGLGALWKPCSHVLGQIYREDFGTSLITTRKDHFETLIA